MAPHQALIAERFLSEKIIDCRNSREILLKKIKNSWIKLCQITKRVPAITETHDMRQNACTWIPVAWAEQGERSDAGNLIAHP